MTSIFREFGRDEPAGVVRGISRLGGENCGTGCGQIHISLMAHSTIERVFSVSLTVYPSCSGCRPMSLPKETDLYSHLKKWLEEQGFTVHGEVHGCDIAAQKDGKIVLVEIKRSINLELVYQIIRRQEVDALVYSAVPAPRDFDNKRWREGVRLFRCLDAGLVIVYTNPDIALNRCFIPARFGAALARTSPVPILRRWKPGLSTPTSAVVQAGKI